MLARHFVKSHNSHITGPVGNKYPLKKFKILILAGQKMEMGKM